MIFKVKTVLFPNSLNKVTYLYVQHDYGYTEKLQNDCVIKWTVKGTSLTIPVSVVLKIFDRFGFTNLQGEECVDHYVIIIPDDYIDRVFAFIIYWPEFQKANGINEYKLNPRPPYLYESDKFALGAMVGPFVGCIFSSENDADNTKNFDVEEMCSMLKIKKVVFNDPATIVYWEDSSKTVVKCQEGDVFDKEKGLAMCFVKKILGNKSNYFEIVKKWTYKPIEKKKEKTVTTSNCKKTMERSKAIKFIRKHYKEFGGEMTIRQLAPHLGLSTGTVHHLICTIREEKN